MEKITAEQDLGGLMLALQKELQDFRRENQALKEMMEDIHCLFKPRTPEKRLTRKERFNIAVEQDMAREKARMIGRG